MTDTMFFIMLTGVCALLSVLLLGLFFVARKRSKRHAERLRLQYESEILTIHSDSQAAVAAGQRLINQQMADSKQESERIRQHYEIEARRAQSEANTELSKAIKELESLRKLQPLGNAEDVQRVLAVALSEAGALQQEAHALLEQSRTVSAEERAKAVERTKEIRQQAEALLSQATRDAGRIVEEANKRAEQIAGDAYTALRDKELLEQAVRAIRNVVEGYGDRYIIPTRSMLDDLAADFGHTAAGETLRAAREHSRRMVEQGQAATCEYVEPNRRETAIRFVIDAFNGRVDAILSRAKHDNHGTLEQEIRDAFSLVNLNGKAFRDARILPAYLDARLAELKWAVIVQELRLKEREEQLRIKEQIREEEKARREYERAMRDAAKEEEMLRKAMEMAQQQAQQATAEQKAQYEQQLRDLAEKLKAAEERNQRAISMAQQTKRGHVYIISNVGSLGDNVYKIGLTRRLEPLDRIRELGDSSVPFEFDVHALIFSEDAPALETKIHKHFVEMQVNKVNFRKEFFRVDLKHIREEIEALGIAAKWTMIAEAAQYRESLAVEKAIKENPAMREAWINRQLDLESIDTEMTEVEEESVR
jgi:hypothetical protein